MSDEAKDLILAAAILVDHAEPTVFQGLAEWAGERGPGVPGRAFVVVWPAAPQVAGDGTRTGSSAWQKSGNEGAGAQAYQFSSRQVPAFRQPLTTRRRRSCCFCFAPKSAEPGGSHHPARGDRGDCDVFLSFRASFGGAGQRRKAIGPRVRGACHRRDGAAFRANAARRTSTLSTSAGFLVLWRRDFNQFMARHPELRATVNAMAESNSAAMNAVQATSDPNAVQ